MTPNIWQGNRVRLRAIEPSDWETFDSWNQDTEMERRAYWIPFPQSKERVRQWAETTAQKVPENDTSFLVIESLAGEVAGSVNTNRCDRRQGTFSYGIAIRREHQRKGYASEAIRLLLRYFFAELRYQKVIASVYSFNEPSIRLHESLGFQLEGRLRRMIYTDGQFHDELIYGLTAEEFAAAVGPDQEVK
jgi:RimJ/RimL family protein N-acetyltransferase